MNYTEKFDYQQVGDMLLLCCYWGKEGVGQMHDKKEIFESAIFWINEFYNNEKYENYKYISEFIETENPKIRYS